MTQQSASIETKTPMTPLERQRHHREIWTTRICFFIAGLTITAWAPLIPFVKTRLNLNEADFGLFLLCYGIGAMVALPIAGRVVGTYGCRKVMVIFGLILAGIIPILALAGSLWVLALTLIVLGVALGAFDCAVSIQSVYVQNEADKPLMSGFHGGYSVGGLLGATFMTSLLTLGLAPFTATLCITVIILALLFSAFKGMRNTGEAAGTSGGFAFPKGIVLLISLFAFTVFLCEGAVLDWSSVFLHEIRLLDVEHAGFGYIAFALTMTIGRLTGDKLVQIIGQKTVLIGGALLAACGFLLVAYTPSVALNLVGYAMIGAGCSNIVPLLYVALGRQSIVPLSQAVPAVTTFGYSGILAGPALIGLVAGFSSLVFSFTLLAVALLFVALFSRRLPVS